MRGWQTPEYPSENIDIPTHSTDVEFERYVVVRTEKEGEEENIQSIASTVEITGRTSSPTPPPFTSTIPCPM